MDGQTITLLFAALSLVLAAGAALWGHYNKDGLGMWPLGSWIGTAVGLVLAFVMVLIVLLIPVFSGYDEAVCERFGVVSGREVRFERFGYMTWDCLVEADDGWVPIDQIMKVDD